MSTWLWLALGAAVLGAAWWIGPRLLAPADELDRDEPIEEVPSDADAEGLGLVDANPLGGFLGSAMPDLAPPDAGDEVGEE